MARSLYFGTRVEQSRLYFNAPMTLAFEYQEALMEAILEHPAAINRLLTLGLGGGSLPAQMHHIFPKCQQTVVELRPAVIDIAYRYFHLPETPHIDTREADAYMFVLQETERYDIIVIDLYDATACRPNSPTKSSCSLCKTDQAWRIIVIQFVERHAGKDPQGHPLLGRHDRL